MYKRQDKVNLQTLDITNNEDTSELINILNMHRKIASIDSTILNERTLESLLRPSYLRIKHTHQRTYTIEPTIKNVSVIKDHKVHKDYSQNTNKEVHTLVLSDFPNYLRETSPNYYSKSAIQIGRTYNPISENETVTHLSHRVEQSNKNVEDTQEVSNLSKKVDEQSQKIASLEKSIHSSPAKYTLSQQDISSITNALISRLNHQLLTDNLGRGIL